MAKSINEYDHKSLSELEIIPGKVMALDNHDFEYSHPFLLAIPEKIVRGFEDAPNGLKVVYWGRPWAERKREEWTIYTKGKIMCLWSPWYRGEKKVPCAKIISANQYNNSYVVEKAYSGKEAIQNALSKYRCDLRLYADCMNDGKLITDRGTIGKFAQKMGLESLLPNQLRFSIL